MKSVIDFRLHHSPTQDLGRGSPRKLTRRSRALNSRLKPSEAEASGGSGRARRAGGMNERKSVGIGF